MEGDAILFRTGPPIPSTSSGLEWNVPIDLRASEQLTVFMCPAGRPNDSHPTDPRQQTP
jgi:hypothetical protein